MYACTLHAQRAHRSLIRSSPSIHTFDVVMEKERTNERNDQSQHQTAIKPTDPETTATQINRRARVHTTDFRIKHDGLIS